MFRTCWSDNGCRTYDFPRNIGNRHAFCVLLAVCRRLRWVSFKMAQKLVEKKYVNLVVTHAWHHISKLKLNSSTFIGQTRVGKDESQNTIANAHGHQCDRSYVLQNVLKTKTKGKRERKTTHGTKKNSKCPCRIRFFCLGLDTQIVLKINNTFAWNLNR